jgi:hypothetical protein
MADRAIRDAAHELLELQPRRGHQVGGETGERDEDKWVRAEAGHGLSVDPARSRDIGARPGARCGSSARRFGAIADFGADSGVSIRGMAGESLTTRERKRKLGFERKSELVRWALERGLLR